MAQQEHAFFTKEFYRCLLKKIIMFLQLCRLWNFKEPHKLQKPLKLQKLRNKFFAFFEVLLDLGRDLVG